MALHRNGIGHEKRVVPANRDFLRKHLQGAVTLLATGKRKDVETFGDKMGSKIKRLLGKVAAVAKKSGK